MKTRKLLTAVTAFLAFAVTTRAQTVPSNVPTNGLVGYWGFNGNANDESGNGNNGTVNGATLTTDRFGNLNSAYSFDGVSNYIGVPNSNTINIIGSQITISYWLFSNNNSDDANYKGISKGGYDVGSGYELMFRNSYYGDDGVLSFTGGTGMQSCNLNKNMNTVFGQWLHLVVTSNNGITKYYIDGIQVGNDCININQFISNESELFFGKRNPINAWAGFLKGKIDDIAIYNLALTQSEITQLYTSTSSTQNLCTKTIQPYNVNVGDATHDGSTYAWSISPAAPNAIITGDGTNSITIDWTNVPDGSYTLQAIETSIDDCVSTAVTATINLSSTPAPTSILQTFCDTATVANLVATGTDVKWYASANEAATLATSTALTTGTYYASQTINGCESARITVAVSLNYAQITADANTVCSGTSVAITTSVTSAETTTLPANLQNGLVGYWPFNGNANDGSGNGNNGTVNGATLTTDRFGNSNGAYSFDGMNNNINIQSVNYLGDSISISTWVNPSSISNSRYYELIRQQSVAGLDFLLSFQEYGNIISFGLTTSSNGNTELDIPILPSNNINGWHNFIAVYDGSNRFLYKDGILIGSDFISGNIMFSSDRGSIGSASESYEEFFHGKIDEVAIYNRALSPEEITQLYNQGQTTYTWSTGETTATINPTPTETTTYWCDVNTNGTTCRKEITITVTPKTIPTFTTPAPVCSGTDIDAFPTISSNDVSGTWSPQLNNLATTEYTFTPNEGQCATTANQSITVFPLTSITTTINALDSYTWDANGITYTTSGTYTFVNGCHTEILELTLSFDLTSEVTVAACGTSYIWDANGMEYTESGDYTNISGSTFEMLHLTLTPATTSEVTVTACGTSYFWEANNTEYTESGDYTNVVDCNTETLHLTILPITQSETTVSICDASYTWAANDTNYTESGVYTFENNCETSYLYLTLTPATTSEVYVAACGTSYIWDANENQYTESGDYTNTVNCHTEILHLTLAPITISELTISACGSSYLWDENGTEYYESGDYISNVDCTSVTLHLTLTPETTSESTVAVCGTSYIWEANNTEYTESGDYTYIVDCHTETLHLLLTPISINTNIVTTCEGYFWDLNGTTYETSGTYTFEEGCHTEILNLTINSTTITTQPISTSICKAIGATASLSVGTAATSATYKWYTQALATATTGAWTLINNNANYSGATTATLNITKTTTLLPATGSKYKVVITNSCGTSTSDIVSITDFTVLSKAAIITVVGTLSPALTTCQGSSVNLSLAAGSIGNIQWQSSTDGINYSNVGSTILQTALSATNLAIPFNTGALTQTTWFRAVASNGVCNSVNATAVKIIVSSPANAGIISGGGVTVCAPLASGLNLSGTTTAFSNNTLLSVAGTTGTILWQKSLNYENATGATPVWASALSTTNQLTVANLAADTWYRVLVTNGACKATSEVVKITVIKSALAGTIISATSVCEGGDITFTSSAYTGTSIQWEVSTTSATSGFQAVNGANQLTFTMSAVTYAPSSIFYVRNVVTNGTCTMARSAVKTINVNPLSVSGTVKGGGTICSGSKGIVTVTGYTGTIQWQSSSDGTNYVNVPTGLAIAGNNYVSGSANGTAATYTANNITAATYFRAKITSGICSEVYSNSVQFTIGTTAVSGTITAANTTVCSGAGTTLTLTGSLGTIQWQKSTNWTAITPTWTAVTTSTSSTLATGNLTVASAYRAIVSIGSCSIQATEIVPVMVFSAPLAKTITANVTSPTGTSPALAICNTSLTLKVLTIGAGSNGTIQWQKSTTSTTLGFTDIADATATSYTITNPTVGANYFRAKFTNSCGVSVFGTAFTVHFKDCAPTKAVTTSVTGKVRFEVVAFPNPFSNNFNLDVTTSSSENVEVRVYDMIGKLINRLEVQLSAISELQIGDSYPAGVYNVVVTQGAEVETVRVIKR